MADPSPPRSDADTQGPLRCRACGCPLPRAIQIVIEDSALPIGFANFADKLGAMVSCGVCGVWCHVSFNRFGAWIDPGRFREGAWIDAAPERR